MSTEQNTPDDPTTDAAQPAPAADETQVLDVTDETEVLDDTQVLDAADDTQVLDSAETQVLDVADETQVVDHADQTKVFGTAEATPAVDSTDPTANAPEPFPTDDEPVADRETSQPVDSTDPFDVFTTAPAQTSSTPAPTVVVDPPVAEPEQRRLRVGTVVWGLVLAACGLGVIAWASGARIDFQLALIVLLAAAGTALLVGSIVSGARRARH